MKLVFLWLIFLFFYYFLLESKGIEKIPIEINFEVERNKGFLKVYTDCYNLSPENREFKIIVKIEKVGKTGKSSMLQSKKVKLLPNERAKPMIAFLGVKSDDFYLIEVQVFDERERLIFYRILTSEGNS